MKIDRVAFGLDGFTVSAETEVEKQLLVEFANRHQWDLFRISSKQAELGSISFLAAPKIHGSQFLTISKHLQELFEYSLRCLGEKESSEAVQS